MSHQGHVDENCRACAVLEAWMDSQNPPMSDAAKALCRKYNPGQSVYGTDEQGMPTRRLWCLGVVETEHGPHVLVSDKDPMIDFQAALNSTFTFDPALATEMYPQ